MSTGTLEHINVRCILDGRKFRISSRRADHHGAGGRDLDSLLVGALHSRLATQTGYSKHSFTLALPVRTTSAAAAPSRLSSPRGGSGSLSGHPTIVSRPLRASQQLSDVARGKRSVLVEMHPFDHKQRTPGDGDGGSELPPSAFEAGSQSPSRRSGTTNPVGDDDRGHEDTASLDGDGAEPQTRGVVAASEFPGVRQEIAPDTLARAAANNARNPPPQDPVQRSPTPSSRPPRASRPSSDVNAGDAAQVEAEEHMLAAEEAARYRAHASRSGSGAASLANAAPEPSFSVASVRSHQANFHSQRQTPTPAPTAESMTWAGSSRAASQVDVDENDDMQIQDAQPRPHGLKPPASRRAEQEETAVRHVADFPTSGGRLRAPRAGLTPPRDSTSPSNSHRHRSHHADPVHDQHHLRRGGPTTSSSRSSSSSSSSSSSGYRDSSEDDADNAASDQRLAELRYQLDVAQTLLDEDRVQWSEEEQELEATCAREVHTRLNAAQTVEAQLSHEAETMRRRLDAIKRRNADFRGRHAGVIDKRDRMSATVDARATQLDEIKLRMLEQLASNGCRDDKDVQMAEKIVYLVTQKWLHHQQLLDSHNRVQKIASDLDAAKYQRRTLHHAVEEVKGNIRVLVRMRPLQSSDLLAPRHAVRIEEGAVDVDDRNNTVTVTSASAGSQHFEYYRVYPPTASAATAAEEHRATRASVAAGGDGAEAEQQRFVFVEQVQPVLQSLFDGVNVSVLAYGQTGSGKTYTIFGKGASDSVGSGGASASAKHPHHQLVLDGLLPQAIAHVFDMKREFEATEDLKAKRRDDSSQGSSAAAQEQAVGVSLRLSMVEVYMSDVFDLLNPIDPTAPPVVSSTSSSRMSTSGGPTTLVSNGTKCEIRALPSGAGAVVAGALELEITSASEAMAAVARGFSARKTHKTLTNPRSSRSHLLLTVYVDVTGRNSRSGGLSHRSSRMMFVDLAGSERVHKSLSSGDRLKEAQHINRSLSALGDILAALTSKSRSQTHVPYRNAKLTHLLQPCIGGDSKTLMVACICPHVPQRHNLGETLSTLAFAARARCVENKVPPVASAIRNGPAVASGRRAND